jgi:preprotein translocase subunit YajC
MFRRIRAAAFLFIFALAAAAQSPAQSWNEVKALAAGTSVRISAGLHTISGQLQEVTDDSIAVESGKKQQAFRLQDVTRVSVKKDAHRGRNTLIGLGAGVAIGATVGAISHKDCTGFCIFYTTRGQDAAIGAAVFGVIGTAVGALIPTGGWREIYRQ